METSLVEFQYLCVHDALVNNYWLHKWKCRDDNVCRLCNSSPEDIFHMFWFCRIVQIFWDSFNAHFNALGLQIVMKDVFVGRDTVCENIIIQYAKKYIYTCFVENIKPEKKGFMSYLSYKMNIEKCIYMEKNRVELWQNRWCKCLDNT